MLSRRSLLLAGPSLLAACGTVRAQGRFDVDLALVLAVDVSRSINAERYAVQMLGYSRAFRSADVMSAIRSGPTGRIAVMFVQWSGRLEQQSMTDWVILQDEETSVGFSRDIDLMGRSFWGNTSISAAIDFSTKMLSTLGFVAARSVIDVSGDGPNNESQFPEMFPIPALARSRAAALRSGVTINGLAIKNPEGDRSYPGLDLERYYATSVIGGPGAFVIPVDDPNDVDHFTRSVRRKLVTEISML